RERFRRTAIRRCARHVLAGSVGVLPDRLPERAGDRRGGGARPPARASRRGRPPTRGPPAPWAAQGCPPPPRRVSPPAGPAARRARISGWLATFRAAARSFRYEVRGLERLRGPSSLIVGYHGGPWALDVFMLSARMHDELGQLPRAIFLETWGWFPVLRDMV